MTLTARIVLIKSYLKHKNIITEKKVNPMDRNTINITNNTNKSKFTTKINTNTKSNPTNRRILMFTGRISIKTTNGPTRTSLTTTIYRCQLLQIIFQISTRCIYRHTLQYVKVCAISHFQALEWGCCPPFPFFRSSSHGVVSFPYVSSGV